MGVGSPEDLVNAVGAGVDMFDCVLPTRLGRNGSLFTDSWPRQLSNARYRDDPSPIDPRVRLHDVFALQHGLRPSPLS